ncbi:hypothetical protein V1514DRAFT_334559 [Lipomyces japonicus]|uniref:uncharacterized protein n=1 Tax=Lipomyces japonicus TaxID=56871 RepID=UPI0034CFD980
MSKSSTTNANASRLLLLADTTLVSVLEHNRLKSLELAPSTSEEAEIQRNLISLRDGIAALEREQSAAESDLEVKSSRSLRSNEDTLIRLQKQFDRLLSLLQEGGADRIISRVTANTSNGEIYKNDAYRSSRSLLLNNNSSSSSPRPKISKTVRFSENLIDVQSNVDESDPLSESAYNARNSATNQEAFLQHQQIMRQQDESLDRLSESISRQRELSIQIGEELDSHVELLGEVDRLVDWGQHRLDGARKRLDKVSRKAKENGSLVTIIILIIVLFLLIILLSCEFFYMYPLNVCRNNF